MSWIYQFAITRKNDAFVAKIVNTPLTKISMALFSPDERLPSPATLYNGEQVFNRLVGNSWSDLHDFLAGPHEISILMKWWKN